MAEMSKSSRAKAMVLAVGTAVPPNIILQSDFPEFYFRVTKSEHVSDEFKEKFARLCKATKIEKRHFYLTEKMLQDNPNIASHNKRSLDARSHILSTAVPELAKEAAEKALQQWGQARSKITHLIFHATSCFFEMPGLDVHLVNLLQLSPSTNRFVLYLNGCSAGGTVLRLAKDIAENNPSARVLVVCSELSLNLFRGPSENAPGNNVDQVLFGDGAAAVILGSDPDLSIEQPLFEIISAKQTLLPGTMDGIQCQITEAGLIVELSRNVPMHVANNIRKCTSDALAPLGITDMNSLFWIMHPGGRKILDLIECELNLEKDKFLASRRVLADYGNTAGSCVFFVMDEMIRRSKEEGKATTGGEEFGLLIGLGPGLTVETLVLRAHANPNCLHAV